MSEATQPWAGFKYEPVRGPTDRRISRYLRTQRKNMRRFFAERGVFDLLARMEEIRKSRQGMMAKNTMFQEVLNEYAERVNQPAATGPAPAGKTGAAPQPNTEAASADGSATQNRGITSASVEVQPAGEPADGERGPGLDPGDSVCGLATSDDREPVIEE
jgi:hypothetical protein